MNRVNLSGRRAVVTGATRGIGHAIAVRLRAHGAWVAGTGTGEYPMKSADLDDFIVADFTRNEEVRACSERVRQIGPDILVNNAGINKIGSFKDIPIEDFQEIQQVNVTAAFVLCQAALPSMKRSGWGRIVNVSSIWGKIGKEWRASYSASKFALDGMTLALALEYAASGILANCVAPGFTDTELTRRVLGEQQIAKILASVPIRRLANVEEIANFVVWLASPENTYITGQNIAIDGGFSRA